MASLRDTLSRTRNSVFSRIQSALGQSDITNDTWEELETLLIQADVGAQTAGTLIERLRARALRDGIVRADKLRDALKEELRALLTIGAPPADYSSRRLLEVIMVIGVNGSGKTTSIAKLCKLYKNRERKIVLAAADTFRAAAVEQLQVWGERIGVDVVSGPPNIDPGAITHDAVLAAFARKADLLIVDTAGRLHTKHNLMQELVKIRNVLQRGVHEAPHQTLIVIDAANGQNAIAQAKGFAGAVGVTGAILTKLDGTPKGGVAFAIVSELGIPIRYIGTGEKIDDIQEFNPTEFVDDLFES
ncbi:MAG: signal recognition particle-docking protein FtsY [Thermoflexales bacterium]